MHWGVGALKSNRLDYLKHLFGIIIYNYKAEFTGFSNHHSRAARILPPYESYQRINSDLEYHEDFNNKRFPLHHKVFDALKSNCDVINLNEEQLRLIFHNFEVLIALNCLSDDQSRMIHGPFCLEMDFSRTTLFSEIKISITTHGDESPYVTLAIQLPFTLSGSVPITTHGDESPYVTSGIFGSSVKDCMERVDVLEEKAEELYNQYL